MFNRHTIDGLNFAKVDQKTSSWHTDITTKKAFEELDGFKQTI